MSDRDAYEGAAIARGDGAGSVWVALIGVVIGILWAPAPGTILLAAVAGALLAGMRRPVFGMAGLLILSAGAGGLAGSWRSPPSAPLQAIAQEVAHCRLRGRVVETAGGLGTLVRAELAECDGRPPIRDAGAAFLDGSVGDAGGTFATEGWVLPLGDDGFGRARARLGGHARIRADRVSTGAPRSPLLAIAAAVRRGLHDATGALEPRRAALIRGVTIGDTSGLDAFTTESFRRSGLAHLVAVSGLHVAIVVGVILLALDRTSLLLRVALAAGGLALYVLIVGPRPSVLRASLMGTIALVALVGGRAVNPLRSLGLALLLLVVVRPAMVHSVGLHLSAAATAGIILWSGTVAARARLVLPRPLALILAATLSAQVAVAPILAGVFGQVSLSAPAANLMAMPAVPPLIVLGLGAGATAAFLPAAGAALARAAEPFAAWVLAAGNVFGSPGWAALEVPAWGGWLLAAPASVAALASWRAVPRRES